MFLIFTKFINYHEWSDEEMKWKLKNLAALAMSAAMVLSMADCGSERKHQHGSLCGRKCGRF